MYKITNDEQFRKLIQEVSVLRSLPFVLGDRDVDYISEYETIIFDYHRNVIANRGFTLS